MSKDIILDIQNVKQIMNIKNVGEKLKSMIIDQKIKDTGDQIEITFILDKKIGEQNNE